MAQPPARRAGRPNSSRLVNFTLGSLDKLNSSLDSPFVDSPLQKQRSFEVSHWKKFAPYSAAEWEQDVISEIVPRSLYLTSWRSAGNQQKLMDLDIKYVVSITRDGKNQVPPQFAGVEYFVLNFPDDTEYQIREHFEPVMEFLSNAREQSGAALVHCHAGISRSATVAISFLMSRDNQSLRDVFTTLYARRRCIWPNEGFMAQLIKFEVELRGAPPSISMSEYAEWSTYDYHTLCSQLSSVSTKSSSAEELLDSPQVQPEACAAAAAPRPAVTKKQQGDTLMKLAMRNLIIDKHQDGDSAE